MDGVAKDGSDLKYDGYQIGKGKLTKHQSIQKTTSK